MHIRSTEEVDAVALCATADARMNGGVGEVLQPAAPSSAGLDIEVQARLARKAELASELEWRRGQAERARTAEALHG